MIATRYPRAINAPGARMKTNIKSPSIKFIPKIAPAPSSSLTAPNNVRANEKPQNSQ